MKRILFLTLLTSIAGQNLQAMNKAAQHENKASIATINQAKGSLACAILGLGFSGIFFKCGGQDRPIAKIYPSLPDTNCAIASALTGTALLFSLYHGIKYWKYFSKNSQQKSLCTSERSSK